MLKKLKNVEKLKKLRNTYKYWWKLENLKNVEKALKYWRNCKKLENTEEIKKTQESFKKLTNIGKKLKKLKNVEKKLEKLIKVEKLKNTWENWNKAQESSKNPPIRTDCHSISNIPSLLYQNRKQAKNYWENELLKSVKTNWKLKHIMTTLHFSA